MNKPDKPLIRIFNRLIWVVALGVVLDIAVFIARRETGEIGNSLRMLRNGEPHERGAAVWELTEAAPHEMYRVVPALIQALSDEDGYVRAEAAAALGKMKLPSSWNQQRIDRFLLGLKDPDFRVQAAVAEGLPPLDVDPDLAVPALIEVAGVGASAAQEGPTADKTSLATQEDWKPHVEQVAFEALCVYARRGNRLAISTTMTQVRNGPPKRQAVAIATLGPLAGSNEKAFDLLLDLTRDQSPERRGAAVEALGFAVEAGGDFSRSAFEELLRLADHPDLETRKHVVHALSHAGRYFSEIIPALDRAFQSKDLSDACIQSLRSIMFTRQLPNDFNPVKQVHSEYPVIRYIAVCTLDLSRDGDLAALLDILHDQAPRVAQQAEMAISRLDVATARRLLKSPTANDDPDLRSALLSALWNAAFQKDRSALGEVLRLSEDRDPSIRARAVQALSWGYLGFRLDDVSVVEKPLYRAFRDENPKVRSVAQEVIEGFAINNRGLKSINPAKSIKGVEPGERFMAVLQSDPGTQDGVAVLIEATRDSDARIRRRALTRLQQVRADSPDVEAVQQALDSATRDQDAGTRQTAIQAKAALKAASKKPAGK